MIIYPLAEALYYLGCACLLMTRVNSWHVIMLWSSCGNLAHCNLGCSGVGVGFSLQALHFIDLHATGHGHDQDQHVVSCGGSLHWHVLVFLLMFFSQGGVLACCMRTGTCIHDHCQNATHCAMQPGEHPLTTSRSMCCTLTTMHACLCMECKCVRLERQSYGCWAWDLPESDKLVAKS